MSNYHPMMSSDGDDELIVQDKVLLQTAGSIFASFLFLDNTLTTQLQLRELNSSGVGRNSGMQQNKAWRQLFLLACAASPSSPPCPQTVPFVQTCSDSFMPPGLRLVE